MFELSGNFLAECGSPRGSHAETMRKHAEALETEEIACAHDQMRKLMRKLRGSCAQRDAEAMRKPCGGTRGALPYTLEASASLALRSPSDQVTHFVVLANSRCHAPTVDFPASHRLNSAPTRLHKANSESGNFPERAPSQPLTSPVRVDTARKGWLETMRIPVEAFGHSAGIPCLFADDGALHLKD